MSVTDAIGYLLLIAVLAPAAGAALAWAMRSPVRVRAHRLAAERFHVGMGRDPNRMAIGPHHSFADNFKRITAGLLGFGVVFLALSAVAG